MSPRVFVVIYMRRPRMDRKGTFFVWEIVSGSVGRSARWIHCPGRMGQAMGGVSIKFARIIASSIYI